MGQKYYIIYMVVASFAAFVYFKLKDNEFEKRDFNSRIHSTS